MAMIRSFLSLKGFLFFKYSWG